MNVDLAATTAIYNFVNNIRFIRPLPYYCGLLPYELYVLPGMFVAIIQVILFSAFNPIQFHLLPHFYYHLGMYYLCFLRCFLFVLKKVQYSHPPYNLYQYQ